MKAQAAKGWAVAGVTGVRQPDSGGKTGADGETVDWPTFYRTPSIAPVRSPIREWREIGALASRIEALVRAWQPDLLHAHSPVLDARSEEHTSELQSLMRISYAVFCLKKKNKPYH